jgi:DNA modification methylase
MKFQKKSATAAPPAEPPPVLPLDVAGLLVEMWPISRPIPYAKNARKLSGRALDVIVASLQEFGFQQPIVVDAKDVIVAGHTRLMGAKKLEMTQVPVHVAANLTPAQCAAYRLMDNRSSQETSWDFELLGAELLDLKAVDFDLALTGFDTEEIGGLLIKAGLSEGLTDEDAVPEPPEDPVTVPGDLWLLGGHRVLCGDSTSVDATQRLCGADGADMVFTDPPYNVDYDPEARASYFSPDRLQHKLGKIKNDTKSPEDFRTFLDLVYGNINIALKPGHPIYICHADTEGHHFRNAFIAQPWKLQSCLIWKKTVLVFGRADYHWMHEPILYGWKEGDAHVWTGDRKQTTIWEIATDHYAKPESDTGGKYVHPTQKPVALPERAISNSSLPGNSVLDLFGGSGSTLIACEKIGRSGRLMELDPKYVDVIVNRWQAFSGKTAILDGDGRKFDELKAERMGARVAA